MMEQYQYTPAKIQIQITSNEVSMPVDLVRRLIDGDTSAKTEAEPFLTAHGKVIITEGTMIELKCDPFDNEHLYFCCGAEDFEQSFEVTMICADKSAGVRMYLIGENAENETEVSFKGPISEILNVMKIVDQKPPHRVVDTPQKSAWIKWVPEDFSIGNYGPSELHFETIVRVKFASGEISEPDMLCEFNWDHHDYENDIPEYQVIKYPD